MKLEDVKAKSYGSGFEPGIAVRISDVDPLGPDALNVSYKLPNGALGDSTTFRTDDAGFRKVTAQSRLTFAAFKLAADATRINLIERLLGLVRHAGPRRDRHRGGALERLLRQDPPRGEGECNNGQVQHLRVRVGGAR